MADDFVAGLQYGGEPEQEDCSTGIVPSDWAAASSEDNKAQEILVPVLTSMSKYLFQHYRLTMYSYLNRSLKNGNLGSIVGFHVQNRVIDRHVCSFGNPTFWRVKRDAFIANVVVTLCLDTGNGNRKWEGFLSLWFQMGETVSYSVEYMGSIEEMADEELPMLSSFLVPIFSNRQMDDETEAIWARYLPEALHHPEKRSAVALAKKMGLSIEYHPVYKHMDIGSILFFEDGELTVWDESAEDADKKEPVRVTIPANTIVINTNVIQERYFFCHNGLEIGKYSNCNVEYYPVKEIEQVVWHTIRELIGLLNKAGTQVKTETADSIQTIASIEAKLKKSIKQWKSEKLLQYELYADGSLSKEAYLRVRDELTKKIASAEQELSAIQAKHSEQKDLLEDAEHLGGLAQTYLGETELTYEIAQAFIENVYVHDRNRIEIVFCFEDEIQRILQNAEEKKLQERIGA